MSNDVRVGGGRFRASAAVGAALSCALTAAGGCDQEASLGKDELGSTEGPIVGGVEDSEFDADHPATVMLRMPPLYAGEDPVNCSGTLVTPRWVLTAAHCIEKSDLAGGPRSDRDWDVFVGPNGNQGGTVIPLTERTFRHSLARSQPIPTHDGPSEPFELRDTDLALVRLDERVPHPIGIHAPLPEAGECEGEGALEGRFWGRLVGFSPYGFEEGGYEGRCAADAGGWRRRRSPSFLLWEWEEEGAAAVYTHLFSADAFEGCTDMAGIGVGGDSGGALYKQVAPTEFPLLCGVISGDGPDNIDGEWFEPMTSLYHTSAVDHIVNLTWILHGIDHTGAIDHDGILDQDGFLEDTYEARGGDDPDGDGIARAYDTCKNIPNPEQLTTHDDEDGDGKGAACDHCPEHAGGETFLDNLNYEMERAVARQLGITGPEHEDYVTHYRPDACDPTPVPLVTLQEGGQLPAGAVPPIPPACGAGFGCSTVVENKVVVDRRSTSVIPAGTAAATKLRFCDCSDLMGAYTHSIEGREQCARNPIAQCEPWRDEFDGGVWKPIKTSTNGMFWSTDATFTGTADADFSVFWDFRDLGDAVQSTASSQRVTGVLWSSVRSLSPPVSGLPTSALETYAGALGSGDASWRHVPNSPRTFYPSRDEAFCVTCPQGLMHPYHEVGYPDWRATIEGGSVRLPAPDAATVAHYEQAATGAVRHVSASEPVRELAELFPPGEAFVRSLGLEGQAVTRVLTSHEIDRPPTRSAWSTSHPSPPAAPGRGYAFSATRQRLYVLGGTTSTGAPRNEGFWLDLPTGVWRAFAIPGAEAVGAVLAAGYRWQDQSVYFLDKTGTSLRLRRWNAQRVLRSGLVQTLATFPASWGAFPKHDLVAVPGGHLLLVGWGGTGTEKTRVGLVTVSPEGVIALERVHKSTTPVMAPPGAGSTGFTTMTRGSSPAVLLDPYAATVSYSTMSAPAATDQPTIHPH